MNIGHLHPLLVHLPIGILVLGFCMELYHRLRSKIVAPQTMSFILMVSTLFSILSLATGWWLADKGGYDEGLLFRHRWWAVGFTLSSVLLFLLQRSTHKMAGRAYFPLFMVTMLALGFTGHYGGSMTHGEGYLFAQEKKTGEIALENVGEALVYDDIIAPIMDMKCTSCHNPKKTKGGLNMAAQQDLLQGGDSGSILDSLQGNVPSLLAQIRLPLDDEDHMPPKGKIQLTLGEIALLDWWMAHNHCFDCQVKDLPRDEKMDGLLQNLQKDTSTRGLLAKELKPVPEDWLANINASGIRAVPLAEGHPLLEVNLSGKRDLTYNTLKRLKKYGKHIVSLNLANGNFNDTLAPSLKPFKNLTALQLQNTMAGNKTMETLGKLQHLELLNLYGTQIDEGALKVLAKLPNLTSIYLWGTPIGEEPVLAFAKNHPDIKVQGKMPDSLFASSELVPPTFITDVHFFKDSLLVELANIFEDVELYYTLDGTEPDSSSVRYKKPITLVNSTQIKAVSYKKDWKLSKTVGRSFNKISREFAQAVLHKTPNDKYKGNGANTLIDRKRGTVNFVDGNWLGFENTHMTTTLELAETSQISQVSIGALSSPSQWIFYPRGITVWSSRNGHDFTLLKTISLPEETPNTEPKLQFFDLDLPATQAKFVKVRIKAQMSNPTWHPNPGGKSWLFLDEIIIN
ncbi:MAG: FN3 associated domain-containing protein [Flavobacteriaceae bacterium]